MKQYTYRHSRYVLQMTLPGVFTFIIGVYSLYCFIAGNQNVFWLFIFLICGYNVWNLFVSLSNPSVIMIGDDKLILGAYSRQHTYDLNAIEHFTMRALAGNSRLYITIGNGGLLRGRYWIRLEEFNDKEELKIFFENLYDRINPDSLFTAARKQNRK